jgi:phage N-6-adenine-methyltransferase
MNEKTFKLMYSSKGHEWYTPLELYTKLDREFHFDIDPCTEMTNRLGCKTFFTLEDDGLNKEWPIGTVFFCNPPYGRKGKGSKWVKKCADHAKCGKGTAVLLIPARTDTKWFHDLIWQKPHVEIRFIQGRLKFENPDHKRNTAPFPSMIVIFHNNNTLALRAELPRSGAGYFFPTETAHQLKGS